MPSNENQIDPETRADMAILDSYPAEHWHHLHDVIVTRGLQAYERATTYMAHMSHAEARELLAFLIGYDIEYARSSSEKGGQS